MPRGGSRPGAGRKAGAATLKTRKVADRAAVEGCTPLDVMLAAMRSLAAAGRMAEAAAVAKDAAPYCHPRLSAIAALITPEQPITQVDKRRPIASYIAACLAAPRIDYSQSSMLP
jgi:hypothetical protein